MTYTRIVDGIPVPMTEEEIAQRQEEEAAYMAEEPKRLAESARSKRDQLLTESDWTQVADAPVDQAAWAIYRQALRDVPQQSGFPQAVEWPTEPE